MRRPTRRLAPAAIGAVLLLGAAACGGDSGSPSDGALEEIIESQGGGDVDIDSDDGEITIESDDGSFSSSSSGELPEGWPDDVPLPDDFEIQGSSRIADGSSGGAVLTVSGMTGMSVEEVQEFYTSALDGWTEGLNMVNSSGGTDSLTLALEHDEIENRGLMLSASNDGSGTVLSLNVTIEGS
jgi:hypothetical protein